MRILQSTATMVAGLLLSMQVSAFDGYVEVRNETGYDLAVLQVSHKDETTWGRDMLGRDDVLHDGRTMRIDVEGYDSPIFDIRAFDEDGDSYTITGVNIAKNNVVITTDDIDGIGGDDSEGYVEVFNRTGYRINLLYISHEDSPDWEENVLETDVLRDDQSVRVDVAGYDSSIFDIRVIDEDGDSYTRWGVNIADEDVTFTGRDLD